MQLTEVPYPLPRNLNRFILKKNKLNSLDENSFSNCSKLEYLNLARNGISNLPFNIFRGVPITILYLQHNHLNLSLHNEVFLPLNHTLIELNIHTNSKLSHRVFNNLYELKSLHIDGDLADGFGESFSTLKRLQKLIISSRLSTLANSTFINFQNISLKNLTLAGAAITEIESEAFRPLKALTYLDLSYNSGLRFANLSHSLNGLSDGLQILMLTNIYGRYNPDTCLDEEFFKELSMKKNLTILKLNKNDLLEISNKMFIYIRSLEYLDISHNQLQYIGGWPLFVVLLVNLKFANFGEQVRKGLDRTHVGNVPVITYSENTCNAKDIKDVPPCKFPKSKGLKEPWCGLCPRNLTVLDLSRSRNDDVSVFPPSLIFGNCQISNYSYRNNEVKKAIGPIVVFRPVSVVPVTFDFGDNGMHCLSPEFLKISIVRGLRVGMFDREGFMYMLIYFIRCY